MPDKCRVWFCRMDAGRSRLALDLRLPAICTARKSRPPQREQLAGGLCDHHAMALAKVLHGLLGKRSFAIEPE
jgi:hypothetical protein